MNDSLPPQSPLDTETAIAAFLQHCALERHLAQNSLDAYRQDLVEFSRFFDKSRRIAEINGETLVAYRMHLSNGRRAAPATQKRRLACLRTLCRWLVRRRHMTVSPFEQADIQVRLPKRLPRCLKSHEVAAMLQGGSHSEGRFATALLVATGMRVGELASLRLSRIDMRAGMIRIIGKGDRERTVFVTDPQLLGQITARVRTDAGDADRALLCGRNGKPRTTASIRRMVREVAASSGLKRRVTPHMLRHTAATLLMERGVDIRMVQQLLGHQSILTTQIYLHVTNEALRGAVSRAHVLGTLGGGPQP